MPVPLTFIFAIPVEPKNAASEVVGGRDVPEPRSVGDGVLPLRAQPREPASPAERDADDLLHRAFVINVGSSRDPRYVLKAGL